MNELQTFANDEFGAVRSMVIEDMPWFVGRDVATALGYAKPQNAIKSHVDADDALNQGIIDSMGRSQPTMLINESGLYSLILSSKLPAAKRFKHWVTSEVLPAIRRSGCYEPEEREDAEEEKPLLPERKITHDDYLRAASIVASCKNERLPYVLAYLDRAGISAVRPVRVEEDDRDKYEVMRLLVRAYNEYDISDAAIGRATGLNRKQINMYRTGERVPRAGRAEYIKAVVEPMLAEQE